MKLAGLASYDKRVARAARTLLGCQGHDGGWGLTLSSVSSIVNTAEVLAVLRAAGVGGAPVRDALGYLAGAVAEHPRPRQKGGRGENTRFVCFGLTGLLYYPEFFTQPEVAGAASWCVGWLEGHQVGQGWPEVAGIDDISLHQTALAVLALARLRDTLGALGPGLALPGGADTGALAARVEPLIGHGVAGLLYHRRPSGAWGWRTYVDTAPSPSKTALCLMAVAAAAGRAGARPAAAGSWAQGVPGDRPLEVGGVHGRPELLRPLQIAAEAGQWLLGNHHRWETFVEDDKDVPGTAWEHMAYALGVQGVLAAGGSPHDRRLGRAWRLMNELWDAEAGLWNEPGASGRRATIRATYYTVCAYEQARRRIAQLGMAGADAATGDDRLEGAPPEIGEVSLVAEGRQIVVSTAEASTACAVSQRLFDLAALLRDAPGGLAVSQIAAALHLAPSSVPKYVQRLNKAIIEGLGGAPVKLVVASRLPAGDEPGSGPWSGYAMVAQSGGGMRSEDP
ncbi:hypothetical protein [Actinomadura litoris]|uniref:hypothetical protein n=1 Tax=Actinomadura litoris TaxID=2678616 RepID=UPI001FA73D87|nr:hypothetical protein [Actinomadura litoris]